MTGPFVIETLAKEHDRSRFASGLEPLDRYFREQATQDVRRRVTACYVAVDTTSGRVAGFDTLSASGVLLIDLPQVLAKRLPRHPSVPVARMGRLAVDRDYRGASLEPPCSGTPARAPPDPRSPPSPWSSTPRTEAEAFYRHHGFQSFRNSSRQLVLTIKSFGGK